MRSNKSIARELVLFSLPLILSGVLQQLYNWADAFIIGHSGPEGEMMLAAVGATTYITVLLINSIVGFTLGISIMAAQEYGRGNIEKIRKITSNFLFILCGVYTVLTAAAIVFVEPILKVMDTPAEIFGYTEDYLKIVFIGVPFLAVYNLFAALFRAVGNTKVAFYAVLISSAMNVVLDVIFVLGLSMGVIGAAAATVISQAAMTVFIVIYGLVKYPDLMIKRRQKMFQRDVLSEGASFGMPPMVQNSVISVGNLALQNFMNNFGAATVLAVTTGYRIDSIMILPIINMGAAISSLVARSKGEEDPVKIRSYMKNGLVLMIGVSILLGVVMFFFGKGFISFFGITGDALAIGDRFFKDLAAFYILFGVATVLRSVLEGIGDITYCSIVGIITLCFRIAFSYILEPFVANRAIALAEAVSWLALLIMVLARIYYIMEKPSKKYIIDRN